MAPTVVVTNFAFLGPVEYWALATAFFILLFMVLLVILIILARKTHAIVKKFLGLLLSKNKGVREIKKNYESSYFE